LNEKAWNKDIADLFDEDSEKLGEEDATKRKSRREDLKKQVLEFNKNADYVKEMKPALEAKQSALEMVERDQMAYKDVWSLLFGEDKAKVEQVEALVKKFAKAKDLDDYELVLEGIKDSLRSKSKPFKPDSSRQGSGGKSFDDMTTQEKIKYGMEHPDKKMK
jgi:hypothetical protein